MKLKSILFVLPVILLFSINGLADVVLENESGISASRLTMETVVGAILLALAIIVIGVWLFRKATKRS